MRKKIALALTLAALPFAVQSSVDAQSRFAQPTQQNTQTRFRGMDSNNDGVVTRNEWRGSAQSFQEHDWNRDGVLSGDEMRVGVPRSNRALSDDDFDPATDRFNSWTPANFATIDRNRDGRIAAREWYFDTESFNRSDRNRDGFLTRAEFLGTSTIDDDRDDRFDNLDADNNGRVERFEWHGSGEAFEWLDRNRDDVLTRAEVMGTAPANTAAAVPNRFGAIDFNGDGRIAASEWQWSRRSFTQRDRNGDGVLTRNEFDAAADSGIAGTGLGTGGRAVATSGQIVRVDPKQRWVDTGLDVVAGDRVTFDAEGTIEMTTGGSGDTAVPAGAPSNRRAANAPLPQETAGALIARIGDSAPLLVGAQRTLQRAPVSGRLYLGVNDDHLDDNSGEYRVSITIQRR
jgi:hypothetical protein